MERKKREDFTYEEWRALRERALDLRSSGFGYERIGKTLNLPWFTVRSFCRLPYSSYPNLNPSPELSYLVGAIIGDGNWYKTNSSFRKRYSKDYFGYIIRIIVNDRDFAEEVARCLGVLLNKTVPVKSFLSSRLKAWRVIVGNHALYNFLSKGCFDEVIERYPREFLRGFFDAEGNAYYQTRKNRLYLSAGSSNKKYIDLVQKALNYLGIESKVYYKKGNFYHLCIGKKENQIRFYEEVGFTIKRKQEVLEKLTP